MDTSLRHITKLIENLQQEKYPEAKVIFLAGSVMRGEATSTSDLDLVVVYSKLPNAFRDSYRYGEWPVEAFVHDPETLKYFFSEFDAPSGYPSLASMVSEGVEVPSASTFSLALKEMADESLKAGPTPWASKDIESARYAISDLIEDIRDPRNVHELHATASQLYSALANFYFRSKGLWSAKGKTIPRRLKKVDAKFAAKFLSAFDKAYRDGSSDDIVSLASDLLANHGGFLFEGYRVGAPPEWRKK